NWLAVSPASGSTPGTLNVQVSPGSLATGSYTGTIQILSSGSVVQTVTVSLNVNAAQNLSLSPSSLQFTYQIGGPTPAAHTISVDPSALVPGSYSGSVAVSVTGACAGTQTISVSLVVSAAQPLTSGSLTFSASSLSFTDFAADPPTAKVVSLACSSGPASFTATSVSNGG